MRVSEAVAPKSRFSRSINVERDTGSDTIESFLPTGRSLDVVRRVTRSLKIGRSGRAFSVTGPHGSGKSSLAVFMSALLAPKTSPEYAAATELLKAVDVAALDDLVEARDRLDPRGRGFIRAVVTANREPVNVTIARALHHGCQVHFGSSKANPIPDSWADPGASARLTPREIRDCLAEAARSAPVLLIIDEFGKNLEAYADSGRDGDPFLLQELAEWSQSDDAPLVVMTMQHLAFEEYVHETSTARRREWVKVQGRFEDIAYVETAAQARQLVASAFEHRSSDLERAIRRWERSRRSAYAQAGLRDLVDGSLSSAYPLHPLTLAVLPELCSRYGQNERTLFSFLTGPEPQAVPAWLDRTELSSSRLPFVRLQNVYDYFVASASTMISSAATGSRWVEIESRIRDATGVGAAGIKILKVIGVLNLISAGGTLRASSAVVALAMDGLGVGDDALDRELRELESRGLITYREFADEYRIWQGSDFDLKGSVEAARRRCELRSLESLLNEGAPLAPQVAARHSQEFGVLRVFERRFSGLDAADFEPLAPSAPWDGRVLFAVTPEVPDVAHAESDKPIVIVRADGVDELRGPAIDAAALADVMASAEAADVDWVARRELVERFAIAQSRLRSEVSRVFEHGETVWSVAGRVEEYAPGGGASSALSDIADDVYHSTPLVPNEMLARRELTSQGAKARRLLIEAMLAHEAEEHLGIVGYPAERAMYEAALAGPGLHRFEEGSGRFQAPTDPSFQAVWNAIMGAFDDASTHRVSLAEISDRLHRPPIGLKDGPIAVVLVCALLLRGDDVALYEHGTLLLGLDDAVAERLVRNPAHFAVKHTAANATTRRRVVAGIAERLGYSPEGGPPTFLGVARRLYAEMRRLEPYALSTNTVDPDSARMRKAFVSALEPDRLLFEDLPAEFKLDPIPTHGRMDPGHADAYVDALMKCIKDLREAYPRLLSVIEAELAGALGEPLDDFRRSFSVHAKALADSVIDPRLKAVALAATQEDRDDREWLENLAMVVADAPAPRSWNDDTVERFRLAATELGGAFRRVNALLSERRALDAEVADAFPVAVTRVDARESRMVLWATSAEKSLASERSEALIGELSGIFGSRGRAREVLLASLLDQAALPDTVLNETTAETRRQEHG